MLAKAQEAAGDRGVSIFGGANAIQQFLSAGLVDEIHLHLIPVLFGEGTRLFELNLPSHVRLEHDRVDVSPNAIHLVYRVSDEGVSQVSCPTVRPTALAWRPGQARPEITSTLLASPGTVASMFSLREPMRPARSHPESRFVNGMPHQ